MRNELTVGTIFEVTINYGNRTNVERHIIDSFGPTRRQERRQADGSYKMDDYTPVFTRRFVKSRKDFAKKAQAWCSAESLAEGHLNCTIVD